MAEVHLINPQCQHPCHQAANAEYQLIDQIEVIEQVAEHNISLLDVILLEQAIRRLLSVHYYAKHIRNLNITGKSEGVSND
jgi:hypothetical protein